MRVGCVASWLIINCSLCKKERERDRETNPPVFRHRLTTLTPPSTRSWPRRTKLSSFTGERQHKKEEKEGSFFLLVSIRLPASFIPSSFFSSHPNSTLCSSDEPSSAGGATRKGRTKKIFFSSFVFSSITHPTLLLLPFYHRAEMNGTEGRASKKEKKDSVSLLRRTVGSISALRSHIHRWICNSMEEGGFLFTTMIKCNRCEGGGES